MTSLHWQTGLENRQVMHIACLVEQASVYTLHSVGGDKLAIWRALHGALSSQYLCGDSWGSW